MTSRVSVPSIIGVGLLAGMVSALLFAALVGGSMAAVPLFAASPLPLMIAGIGWTPAAALIGAVAGALVLLLELGVPAALVSLGVAGVPAVLLGHLVERCDDGRPVPAGRIAMATAVLMAVVTLAGAIAVEFDFATTTAQVVAAFHEALIQSGTPPAEMPEAMSLEPLVRASVRIMPAFVPAFWTLVLVLDLVIAAKLLRRFDRVERPVEDLAMVVVSPWASLVFAAGLAGVFLPGGPGVLAEIAAGAAFAPLFLVGMGLLTHLTRATDMRWILRATAYGLVLLFPVAALAMALAGAAETFLDLRWRPRPGETDRS